MRLSEGSAAKLGASWDGRGTNFAIFSAHAEKIELCLFDRNGRREIERIALPERTEDIWHGYLHDVVPGQIYGYRVSGPYDPHKGHRFNSNKLLLDPYAKKLTGRLAWSDAHFAYRAGSPREDLSFDRRDNARGMLKAIVVDETFNWGRREVRPSVGWEDTIIYEAHVKGLTNARSDLAAGMKGTYRALAAPEMIAHLKRLGVTTVELLPIHGFIDDKALVERKLVNYWGYNSIAYFAAEERYATESGFDELRATIARLHDAGFEVLLDVVYNHTAEGNHLGPTFSFRGIDNASYYWLHPEDARYYDDFTGCGNSLNLTHPRVLQLVMDSLRYWTEVYHVDGFRFDLATTLCRGPQGFEQNGAFLTAVRQDPSLASVKLVAEPWDVGLGGYQVGAFPSQWSEWNDRYRSIMRRFWAGDDASIGEVSGRMTASSDLFNHDGRQPRASINHITVHDGFTLADLFAYNTKHNEANGENNRDGSNDNYSNNCGHEGPTDNPDIAALRLQLRKNQLATLYLAQGVPLLLAGDEVANSQSGNNNAYCQDSEIGWVNWDKAGSQEDLTDFIGKLSDIRRGFPQISSRRWVTGKLADGSYGVLWLRPDAAEMTEPDWSFPGGRFLAYVLGPAEHGKEALFVVLNASTEAIDLSLPRMPEYRSWKCVLSTVSVAEEKIEHDPGAQLKASPRCVMAFAGQP